MNAENFLNYLCTYFLRKLTPDFMIHIYEWLFGSFFLLGHAAEAKWQIAEQGVEKEVRHPVWQRRADLPPEFTCECGPLAQVVGPELSSHTVCVGGGGGP